MSSIAPAPGDTMLPLIEAALDARVLTPRLQRALEETGSARAVEVLDARVARHKPGRRCIIEYDVKLERLNGDVERATLIGKMRVRSADRTTYALMRAFRAADFTEHGARGFCVPEPLGLIPELHMWLQRKVAGVAMTQLLDDGFDVRADAIARALNDMQHALLSLTRGHTVADELGILRDRFARLREQQPSLRPRLDRLFAGCANLALAMGDVAPRTLHRDFYPDHVLADDHRLWLIDFDLCSAGDPALDMGNFIAHVTELAVRVHDSAAAFAAQEHALTEAYVRYAGTAAARRVHVFVLLALARHVSLSTQFADRLHTTASLLELCEERLRHASTREMRHVRFA